MVRFGIGSGRTFIIMNGVIVVDMVIWAHVEKRGELASNIAVC